MKRDYDFIANKVNEALDHLNDALTEGEWSYVETAKRELEQAAQALDDGHGGQDND